MEQQCNSASMHTVGDVLNKVYLFSLSYIIRELTHILSICVYHANSHESKGMLLKRRCSRKDLESTCLIFSKVYPLHILRISLMPTLLTSKHPWVLNYQYSALNWQRCVKGIVRDCGDLVVWYQWCNGWAYIQDHMLLKHWYME